jgi:hypothetical protein
VRAKRQLPGLYTIHFYVVSTGKDVNLPVKELKKMNIILLSDMSKNHTYRQLLTEYKGLYLINKKKNKKKKKKIFNV